MNRVQMISRDDLIAFDCIFLDEDEDKDGMGGHRINLIFLENNRFRVKTKMKHRRRDSLTLELTIFVCFDSFRLEERFPKIQKKINVDGIEFFNTGLFLICFFVFVFQNFSI